MLSLKAAEQLSVSSNDPILNDVVPKVATALKSYQFASYYGLLENSAVGLRQASNQSQGHVRALHLDHSLDPSSVEGMSDLTRFFELYHPMGSGGNEFWDLNELPYAQLDTDLPSQFGQEYSTREVDVCLPDWAPEMDIFEKEFSTNPMFAGSILTNGPEDHW